ncbi:MAG: hypothetical protein WAZ77_17620 [Candidatus Nitrosopolaris sp.]|jgi:hypothetical protein
MLPVFGTVESIIDQNSKELLKRWFSRTIRLGMDLNRSSMFTPYSEDISKITNLTLGTQFIAFLTINDVRLLLPDPNYIGSDKRSPEVKQDNKMPIITPSSSSAQSSKPADSHQ